MHEHRAPALGRSLEHRDDPFVVEHEPVHRREEAGASQAALTEPLPDPGAGVGRRRVQHERSGQARRVPGGRFRDRPLVTRDARHDGGARHAVMVELRHPSIRERGGRTRWIPPECCRQIDGRVAGRRRRRVAAERCEETGREEMAVRVVEVGCLRFGHRCGLWRRGGSPSPPVTGGYRRATPRAFARLDSKTVSQESRKTAQLPPFPSKQPLLRYGGKDIRVVVPDTVHPGADGAPLVRAGMGFTEQFKEAEHRR